MGTPRDAREEAGVVGATIAVGGAAIAGATQTSATGPILAFVGALIVALLTAREARRRQGEQLAHDRRMRDAEHVRLFLDEAAERFESYLDAVGDLAVALETVPPARVEDLEISKGFADLGGRVVTEMNRATVMARRMDIRFDPDEALRQAYFQAVRAVHEARGVLPDAPPLGGEQLEAYDDAVRRAMGAWAGFTTAAQALVGASFEESRDLEATRETVRKLLAELRNEARAQRAGRRLRRTRAPSTRRRGLLRGGSSLSKTTKTIPAATRTGRIGTLARSRSGGRALQPVFAGCPRSEAPGDRRPRA